MPGSPLKVPNVESVVWPAFIVTGKAGAALAAGDVVATTDSLTFNKVTTAQATGYKGIVAMDGIKTSFATGDLISVLIVGMGVAKVDAAVLVGDALEGGATSGQLRVYVVGADTPKAASDKLVGRALTVGGANAKALVMLRAG